MSANNFIFIQEKTENDYKVSERDYETSEQIQDIGTFDSLRTAVEEAEKHISDSEIEVEYGIRFDLKEKNK